LRAIDRPAVQISPPKNEDISGKSSLPLPPSLPPSFLPPLPSQRYGPVLFCLPLRTWIATLPSNLSPLRSLSLSLPPLRSAAEALSSSPTNTHTHIRDSSLFPPSEAQPG
jgi:hypothetical protein